MPQRCLLPQDIPFGSVLGINCGGSRDSSIAIVAPEGKPLFCMALERLTRSKQDAALPQALLDQIPWHRISRVVLPYPITNTHPYLALAKQLPLAPIGICHHLSHAATAFWGSGFDQALCLVYDDCTSNNPWFGGIYQADRSHGIVPLARFSNHDCPGITSLYAFVTAVLGFTPNRHEGKITGLAAFGKPTDASRDLLASWYQNIERLAPGNHPEKTAVEQSRRDAQVFSREEIAASLQEFCELHIEKLLQGARKSGWSSNKICLSGSLFANVKINQHIASQGFDEIFVAPPMGDDGTALGAAWLLLAGQKEFAPPALASVYLGPSFSTDDIRRLLENKKIRFETLIDPGGTLAGLLANGSIIGVFQDAMEFGPRALGNRSILAPAINPEINQRLNALLHRTEFMPFAPIVRIEDAQDCFVQVERIMKTAAFMTVTADCTEAMRQTCPAVVHVDGTARPQLLAAKNNPLIHDILTRYKNLTGQPALINTSFNIHEEPIVCTPQDALQTFFTAGFDYLFFGENLLVSLAGNRHTSAHYRRRAKPITR